MSQDKTLKEKIFGKGREDYEVAADKAQAMGHKALQQAGEAQRLAEIHANEVSQRAHEITSDANQKIHELQREGNLASDKATEMRNATSGHVEGSSQDVRSH